ncbi:chemoreceptor glutamine deamidase CheD [Rheinheimera sp. UJ51]|uniref:chemoreceptor glutamine deamidase CheD n=1 Tax=unclassified Rheinheimera TaxID=115860 RepID=UPI001E4F8481|nr:MULTISPECIES: chemoreceptor glutamine deamidase CheD [unclassified Rheinheimera]MCC5451830.1 chemoreceptor glutamine deamidase CheD [Rheinheimera sp. UJ51]MCF4009562.1 chemoreceptor glutamine deamidase CheD [Rheinheimera sp. UJ63]
MTSQREELVDGINSYFDTQFKREAVKILPGEYFATRKDPVIVTVLGSCVAACLRDPVARVSGMNHFLLPTDTNISAQGIADSARYGNFAMEKLINEMLKLGAQRERLQAKVFGGGNVLKGLTINNVGERNAEFILDYLAIENITLLNADLLDCYPRKVYFFPESGKVSVRKIKSLNNTTILDRESLYRSKLREIVRAGDVELFEE